MYWLGASAGAYLLLMVLWLLWLLWLLLKAGWDRFGGMVSTVVSGGGDGLLDIILTGTVVRESRFLTITMARRVVLGTLTSIWKSFDHRTGLEFGIIICSK